MTEPHKVSEPSVFDLYRENQGLRDEIERLHGELARVQTISDNYYALVVELNAREAKLRDALESFNGIFDYTGPLEKRRREALATPADNTALKERLAKERERCEAAIVDVICDCCYSEEERAVADACFEALHNLGDE